MTEPSEMVDRGPAASPNAAAASPESAAFYQLDERIQQFIWAEGWESLRDAQEAAIPLILKADQDVIIAAATAAGKTEAAFLPALTHLLASQPPGLIVYVSPIKALINDQFGRLDRLCERLEVPVWPWHGDISSSSKTRFMKLRHGVLLITPESVEAMLCNKGSMIGSTFERIAYFVIDELHAFIGSERGKQLQSQMHRIETVLKRKVPRIGLSATLGDMRLAAEYLRPGGVDQVAMVESKSSSSSLKILVKGYQKPIVIPKSKLPTHDVTEAGDDQAVDEVPITAAQIAAHLFKSLRGSNNLVFPNSRQAVEVLTHELNRLSEVHQVPSEFWPHHGSLSKEIRGETEAALKQKELPATAICTNTLELGIDIGAVKSVAQIGPPPTVASLRQRLGRSGRRKGEPAILRGYCVENELDAKSTLRDELRLGTLQMSAMIELLMEGWFEPPMARGAHLSTLIQQTLSFIAQHGGASIRQAYSLLCAPNTPFAGVTPDDYKLLIQHMGSLKLLMQSPDGTLLHGTEGEKHVNHYSFYAAFATEDEYRIMTRGRLLGTMPLSMSLTAGDCFLFAGRTWRVDEVDDKQKTIYVTKSKGGAPPKYTGTGGNVHTKVRQRMRLILESSRDPIFLDEAARRFIHEARACYRHRSLANTLLIDQGHTTIIQTWYGDTCNRALALLLKQRGLSAANAEIGIEIQGRCPSDQVEDILRAIANETLPPIEELLTKEHNLERQKWDWALPLPLLQKSFASLNLDFNEARTLANELAAGLIR